MFRRRYGQDKRELSVRPTGQKLNSREWAGSETTTTGCGVAQIRAGPVQISGVHRFEVFNKKMTVMRMLDRVKSIRHQNAGTQTASVSDDRYFQQL